MPVTRDPNHPEFPHATARGAARGCKCAPCRRARERQSKRNKHLRAQGLSSKVATKQDAMRARGYVRSLLHAVPGASLNSLAAASGLSRSTLARLMELKVSPGTCERVLRLAVADVIPHVAWHPADRVYTQLRRLQAAGFSVLWLCRQSGNKTLPTVMARYENGRQTSVSADVALLVQGFVDQYGWRDATVEDGLSIRTITWMQRRARSEGFYPPYCYDEDGNLQLRWLPGHPWAEIDDDCSREIEVMRLLLSATASREIERQYPTFQQRRIERIKSRLGLRMEATPGEFQVYRVHPDCADVAERIRQVIADYDEHGLDPVRACLMLGTRRAGSGNAPADHPEVAAWLSEQQQTAAQSAAQSAAETIIPTGRDTRIAA